MTYNLVGIHDGLQTVSDSQERNILSKLSTQRFLNDRICFIVWSASQSWHTRLDGVVLTYRRSGLIEDEELAPAHNRTG